MKQIDADEAIANVSADRAYDTKACYAAIAVRGAMAVISLRKNTEVCKGGGPGAHDLEALERLSPAQPGETKMRCFKRLGERVMARSFKRQVA